MAPFDGEYMTSYFMAMVLFALSVTVYEIFAIRVNRQTFDLGNEGQGQTGEKKQHRHSTVNV